MLQILAALLYYKLGFNVVTSWGSFIITNWGSYYKLGQPLLQNREAITNWDITGGVVNKP